MYDARERMSWYLSKSVRSMNASCKQNKTEQTRPDWIRADQKSRRSCRREWWGGLEAVYLGWWAWTKTRSAARRVFSAAVPGACQVSFGTSLGPPEYVPAAVVPENRDPCYKPSRRHASAGGRSANTLASTSLILFLFQCRTHLSVFETIVRAKAGWQHHFSV